MQQRNKENKKNIKGQLRDREGGLKGSNIHSTAIPEEDGGHGREAILEEIVAENLPELKTDLYPST